MITIKDYFGWIGALVSVCFFASPIFKFINLIKKKIKYTEIYIMIIIANYISSFVWLIYGYEIKNKQIIVCYSIGALISLIYIWIYLAFFGKKKKNQALISTIIILFSTFFLYILLVIIINDIKILGEVCFMVCSLLYISPTQLLIKVINTKDFKLIPIFSAILSAVGYGSWTIFGLLEFNATIIIPNLIGLCFSLAQIIIYRVYKNKKALTEEIGNISSSVIDTMKNVVEKTVEIANSINPNIPQNNNAPAPPNISTKPLVNNDSINIGNNDFNANKENNNENNENHENIANENVYADTNINFNINQENNVSANENNKIENNNNLDVPKI